ncbi:superoxide dismutase [Bacillus swezeyi]|uniref:superoxide dismutase n=1 Tax=Bacillus swezeyi TaxID=1925020 RepID=A0A5M8RYA3_9BACI|nr:superoxide dismutase [Bacillus swezeyi]KAA6451814.1 superoxide dismutase [Bacillus swezeyi]KAA6482620.1 superoxide dismutase [Bacillus swezeyi]TYS36038.1 superoxide dismutase [Bacillus swezeyi]
MNRDVYKEELATWAKDIKNQVKHDSSLESRLEELFRSLDDPDASEQEWYEQAEAVYQAIGRRASPDHQQYRMVPIGGHRLPRLPYSYSALEPYISKEIMFLHHTKHHQSYVDGLNKAERELQKARQTKQFQLVNHWERELAFHGAGHYLHTIFWYAMHPQGKRRPTGELLEMINRSFGSYSAFKEQFSEAAKNVEGVGWAILVWAPRSHRLEILIAEKHQLMSQWDVIPLLPLDVWEHAYYLQYKNEKAKYVDNWWNVVDWREPERRFAAAKRVQWEPF